MPRGLVSSEVQRQESKERGPEVSKCHRVQTFLVIRVIITLVTSCWTSAFRAPAPAVPSSQQLAAISPGLIINPPPTRKAGLWLPLTRNCLYSPSCREEPFSETQRYIKEPRRRKPSSLEHVSNNTSLLDWPTRPRPRCSPDEQPCRRVRQASSQRARGHHPDTRMPR